MSIFFFSSRDPSKAHVGTILSSTLNLPLKTLFDFDEEKSKDQAFERELSKLNVFLRTLRKKDIANVHEILKFTFKKLK